RGCGGGRERGGWARILRRRAAWGGAVCCYRTGTGGGGAGCRLTGYENTEREAAARHNADRRLQLVRGARLFECDHEGAVGVETGAADGQGVTSTRRLSAELDRKRP